LSGRLIAVAILGLAVAGTLWAARPQNPQLPSGANITDPIALLNGRIARGEVKLRFTPDRGYLASVLKELGIPASSQTLVFSKTSLQTDRISPANPRALYFNDDVYVGWIPDAPMLEVASVDPRFGTLFYTLPQAETKTPSFVRLDQPCISCHGPVSDDVPAPLILMMSSEVNDAGDDAKEFLLTTDRSPMSERWGGWYVTGTTGSAKHMGRKLAAGTKRYPTAHSDVTALMLLAHQSEVHNRISEVSQKLRIAGTTAEPAAVAEPLVRTLLFSREVLLSEPIKGSSNFAAEFSRKGPKDRRGRSLRDLDLKSRLLRYPLSYLIYSDAFRQLPTPAKDVVYRRLREVLSGSDQSEDFRHLTSADRTAIAEILTETLPEYRRYTIER